jgi:hypothetical protein
MARNDGRIEPGQKLSSAISARAWNRAQQAADVVLGERDQFATSAKEYWGRAANVIYIRNDSNADVGRCHVLGIAGVVVDPTSSDAAAAAFVERPVLTGWTPQTGVNDTKFAICIEPIAIGGIGRAAVGGMLAVKVRIDDESHGFATVLDGDATQLRSAGCGILQLLWKESGTGDNKWAVGVM